MDLENYLKLDDFLVCTRCQILTDVRDWMYTDVCPQCGENIEFALGFDDLNLNEDPIVGNSYIV